MKNNRYAINQSPLYMLKSKKKLGEVLYLSLSKLERLTKKQDNYIVFLKKSRVIEQPKPLLEVIHRRLFNLLIKIETPAYLHSGVKGRSYITNAKAHLSSNKMVTLDIKKFFPSTKGWHVFNFFNKVMKCSPDVAYLLTALCTYDNHIPTGSCLSQVIAFYAHYEMFEEIYNFASSKKLIMTCYVDDISISGNKANKSTIFFLRKILSKERLDSSKKKEHVFGLGIPKMITGSVIVNNQLKLPNHKHKIIDQEIKRIKSIENREEKLGLVNQTLGRAIAAKQSDKNLSIVVLRLQEEKKKTLNQFSKKA